jgi:uncharacterized membrane protein YfcA
MKAMLAVAVVGISVGVGGCAAGAGGGGAKCPEVMLSEGVTAQVIAASGTLSTFTVSVAGDTVHKPSARCLMVMAADTVRKP